MLAMLVKQFHLLEEEILQAIGLHNEDAVNRLDRKLEKKRQEIVRLRPADLWQRKQQVDFLLKLALTGNDHLLGTQALEDVNELIGEYIEGQGAPRAPVAEQQMSERIDRVSGNPRELAELLDSECSDDLFSSNLRISIIDCTSTYRRTSCGNALFYNRMPNDIAGRRVAELIGAERFEGRARTYLEQCYQGQSVQYYHLLDHCKKPGESAIMHCEMIPHVGSGGSVRGAVVIMRDVTLECTRPDQLELAGLN